MFYNVLVQYYRGTGTGTGVQVQGYRYGYRYRYRGTGVQGYRVHCAQEFAFSIAIDRIPHTIAFAKIL